MTIEEFASLVVGEMPFKPTGQQRALIDALARFCSASTPSLSAFIINGYAGTGKTSVVAALVGALNRVKIPTVLLAPTGRAAKVLGNSAGRKALTIHRKIYRNEGTTPGIVSIAGVADNPHTGAVFIVDEASMIGSSDSTTLLDDLCQYVYGGHDCKIIFLGDTAQLPPVGCDKSPAMSVSRLHSMGLRVSRAVLTQTVRQTAGSGILYNATDMRRAMLATPLPPARLTISPFNDVAAIPAEDLEDAISSSFSNFGIDETILITRSNKRAMDYNLAIRNRILEKDEIICRDEPLLICKNNYFWTSKLPGGDFIANGDIATVSKIYGIETIGMLIFADVQLTMPDRNFTFDAKLILNTLNSETAGLSPSHEEMLARVATADAPSNTSSATLAAMLKKSPYYNALRVKYAYALTCHKAQGSQWASVFVDTANISAEALQTIDFYRWLYTATTRATTRVSFIEPSLQIR